MLVRESAIGDYLEQKFEMNNTIDMGSPTKVGSSPLFGQEKTDTELEVSGNTAFVNRELSMKMLMRADLRNAEQLEFVTSEIRRHRGEKRPYRSFFPIKRTKGTVKKVHRLGMNNYARFIYVNPIDGVLISYQNQSKFPHSPSYIIKLSEIKECGVLLEAAQARWFFKRNHYYFIVRSDSKTSYFFHENLKLVNYWVNVI